MVVCSDCSKLFPALNEPKCARCMEMLKPEHSGLVLQAIEKIRQCSACGTLDPSMDEKCTICTYCVQKLGTTQTVEPPTNSIASIKVPTANTVKAAALAFTKQASGHRLHQLPRPQNPNLAKALLSRRDSLYKHKKQDILSVEIELFMYPQAGKAAHKTQTLPWHQEFLMTENTRAMMDNILEKALEHYVDCPRYRDTDPPSFKWESVQFGTVVDGKPTNLDKELFHGDVLSFYNQLKTNGWLPVKRIQTPSVPLRIYVYEDQADPENETSEGEKPKSTSSRVLRQKVDSRASRASNKGSYSSSYKPRNEPMLSYDSYPFTRFKFEVDDTGTVSMVRSVETEPRTLLVARGWRKFFNDKLPGQGGYIGNGWSKVAVKGRIGNEDFAVLQKHTGTDEAQHFDILAAEGHLLALVNYFLQTFYVRAKAEGAKNLPEIRCNTAFLGQLNGDIILPDKTDIENSSLIFRSFLFAPLVTGFIEEKKFSGHLDFTPNHGLLGETVDAFTHHAFLDSGKTFLPADLQGFVFANGSFIIIDPQGHSLHRTLGPADSGPGAFSTFQKEHVCNVKCRALHLASLKQKRQRLDVAELVQ